MEQEYVCCWAIKINLSYNPLIFYFLTFMPCYDEYIYNVNLTKVTCIEKNYLDYNLDITYFLKIIEINEIFSKHFYCNELS